MSDPGPLALSIELSATAAVTDADGNPVDNTTKESQS